MKLHNIIVLGFLLLITLFMVIAIPIQEARLRSDFCNDNPNATTISASDYTNYERFLMSGNKAMNITESINCKQREDG